MGTVKHSKASKKRWSKIPKADRIKKMSDLSKKGWAKLSPKERRLRAKKGRRTRKALLLQASQKKEI